VPNLSLLRRVANGETNFGRRDVQDATDGAAHDALVLDLQELERYGYVELKTMRNHQTSKGQWYAVHARITDTGREHLGT
jgi:hypothetical protein